MAPLQPTSARPPAQQTSIPPLLLGSIFVASFAIYATTCYRTAAGGDSAEFVTVGMLFPHAIAHPPGYPLYSMLVAVAVRLPPAFRTTTAWLLNCACPSVLAAVNIRVKSETTCTAALQQEWDDSAAFAANLLSAALGAFATVLVAVAGAELVAILGDWQMNKWGLPASCFAAALFALHPMAWLYSLQAEVFALNNTLLAALLLVFLWAARASAECSLWRCAKGGAFIIGLALSNQHTAVYYAMPLVLAILALGVEHRFLCQPRRLGILAGFLLAGLGPYIYLPFAQVEPHAFTWPAEAGTVSGILQLLLRRDYGTLQLQGTRRWELRVHPDDQEEEEPWLQPSQAGRSPQPSYNISDAQSVAAAIAVRMDAMKSRVRRNAWHFFETTATKSSPLHFAAFVPGAALGSLVCCSRCILPNSDVASPLLGRLAAVLGIHAALLFYLLGMCSLANVDSFDGVMGGVLERFWLQPLVILAPLQAVGTARVLAVLPIWEGGLASGAAEAGVGAVFVAAVAWVIATLWKAMDRSDVGIVEDFYGCVLAAMPMNATVLLRGDAATYLMRYWQAVKKARPDVLLLASPLLSERLQRLVGSRVFADFGVDLPPGPGLRHFLEPLSKGRNTLAQRRPLVLVGYYGQLGPRASPAWPLPGFDLWPLAGPSWLVLRDEETKNLDAIKWVQRQISNPGFQCTARVRHGGSRLRLLAEHSWERTAAAAYWTQIEHLVIHAVQWAVSARPDEVVRKQELLFDASQFGEQLLRVAPEVSPAFARTLGLAHRLRNDTEKWLHVWGAYVAAPAPAAEVSMQRRIAQEVCGELVQQQQNRTDAKAAHVSSSAYNRVIRAVPALAHVCKLRT